MDFNGLCIEGCGDFVKRVLTGHDEIFGPWLAKQCGRERWVPDSGITIGLWQDGVGPIAGLIYENSNKASIVVHMASVGKGWLNREFLWFGFYYPFVQLKVKKIIGPVYSDNLPARRLVEHLGFKPEATLRNAAPNGDIILYTLEKDECKWLNRRELYSERRR